MTPVLHGELVAAGIPVVTVRGAGGDGANEPSAHAVIVLEDGAKEAAVAAVVAAHVPSGAPQKAFTAAEREASLRAMEKL
jgi:hypothetical protein